MELKLHNYHRVSLVRTLLIVPYGIETFVEAPRYTHSPMLLIVPYGIETYHRAIF